MKKTLLPSLPERPDHVIAREALDTFVRKLKLRTSISSPTYATDAGGWKHRAYTVTINGHAFPYMMGLGLSHAPEVSEVLASLSQEAEARTQTFEEWAGDYGYDTDSRTAEAIYKLCRAKAIYKLCRANGRKLRSILTPKQIQHIAELGSQL